MSDALDVSGTRHSVAVHPPHPALVGASDATRELCALVRRVAICDAKVLITGESGVGKDVVARAVHAHSPRASRACVPVNCAGLSDALLESELFGHVKGSFTGAYRDKVGRLQLADGGTIFLDELGEMSLRMQALLLRFLENGEIQPVGSEKIQARVNVRVIAATNRQLESLIAAGTFREDLLYRIRVIHIQVPPLRERRADIRPLVEHKLQLMGRALHFTPAAWELLESYRWPGNVRELFNVIEQISWLCASDLAGPEDLPPVLTAVSRLSVVHDRRVQASERLFRALCSGQQRFWDDVYPQFMRRDLTRNDLRDLVRRGLVHSGSYRALLPMFGIADSDYKRFLNFLASHGCAVDLRALRGTIHVMPGERWRA